MKKVAIYVRVSTTEQVEGYSIGAQKERLINYCKAKEWNIYNIYIDGGFTGSNRDRPALIKMLNEIDHYDIVLVYKLDRLSRSQKDTLYLIEEKFLPYNVDFVSLQESFDTSTPFGRAMIGILSVFAQLERETIIERSKMGLLERAKQGKWGGNGTPPIGYDEVDSKLIINDYEAMQVKEIFVLYLQGYGSRKIANILDKKGYKHKYGSWIDYPSVTIIRLLRNVVYIGSIKHKDNIFKGNHEAIIDVDTFNKVQVLLNKKSINRRNETFLLSGLLFCSNCGARMRGHATGKKNKYYYYVCYSKGKFQTNMIKDISCKFKNINKDKLEDMVIDKIKGFKFNQSEFERLYNDTNVTVDNSSTIKNKIIDLDKQINKLMDLYQDNKIPTEIISERIERLYNEKKSLESSFDEVAVSVESNFNDIVKLINNFEFVWELAEFDERRAILQDMIKKVIVYQNKIEIEWNK